MRVMLACIACGDRMPDADVENEGVSLGALCRWADCNGMYTDPENTQPATSEPAPWESALLAPFPPSPPMPVPLYVHASDVQPGMRIHNGYDPYMAVREVIPHDDGLTTLVFTVGDRQYAERWISNSRMPVATPSLYRVPRSMWDA